MRALAERHRRGADTDRLSYASVALLELRLTDGGEPTVVTLPCVGLPQALINPPRRPPTRFQTVRPTGPNVTPPPARTFDLAELFTTDTGLLRDRDRDEIPDDADMMIVIPGDVPGDGSSTIATAELGARLGLESTGLTFPLLGFDRELEDPEIERQPLVLVGGANTIVEELDRLGKLRGTPLDEGIGRIEVVPDALNQSSAVVVTGGDPVGETAAVDYLAARAPYLWDVRRGAPTLSDAKDVVRRLLDGRTAAAQAALGLGELDELLEDLDDLELESLTVDAYLEDSTESFATWLERELTERLDVEEVTVKTHRRHDAVEVFTEEPELEWEVDTFRTRFQDAVPRFSRGSDVEVELRVSESPELRAALVDEIRSTIEEQGGTATQVKVLSAFKQGLSWLMDDVASVSRTDRSPQSRSPGSRSRSTPHRTRSSTTSQHAG